MMLTSRDIPQKSLADTVALTLALLRGEPVPARLSRRHAGYARHAAQLLGLLVGDTPTPAASDLVGHEIGTLRRLFRGAAVCQAWLAFQQCADPAYLDPETARAFLDAAAPTTSAATRKRRSSTLKSWLAHLYPSQQGLFAQPPPLPDPLRIPHNEGSHTVRPAFATDLAPAVPALLITGYAGLDSLLPWLASRTAASPPLRLLIGHEPVAAIRAVHLHRPLRTTISRHWRTRGLPLDATRHVFDAIAAFDVAPIDVRYAADRRPLHARMCVTPEHVTLGSSGTTPADLDIYGHANARLSPAEPSLREAARELAEALWADATPATADFLHLLARLVEVMPWTDALARACAILLSGDWASSHPPRDPPDPPLWPHQREGIAQALYLLDVQGCALVADATGSGKTRMGAWTLAAAVARRTAHGRETHLPVVVAPPAVTHNWTAALEEAGHPWHAISHGLLSHCSATPAAQPTKLQRTELLAVDEAHNFVRDSNRTRQVVANLADQVVLFTATPISRQATDLLALVEILGADHFDDATLATLGELHRVRHRHDPRREQLLAELQPTVRSLMVRRTRRDLNRIVDRRPSAYALPSGRIARYPEHHVAWYDVPAASVDLIHAAEIVRLASELSGIGRLPKVLKRSPHHASPTDEAWLATITRSTHGLARFSVLDALRSSRVALWEHLHGTADAARQFALPPPAKSDAGDILRKLRDRRHQLPPWRLSDAARAVAPTWLLEAAAFTSEIDAEIRRYGAISEHLSHITDARERAKARTLVELAAHGRPVLGFDRHIISLAWFHDHLTADGHDTLLLTGHGGSATRRKATASLGLRATPRPVIALCSDALSEGINLQGAASLVHLDTPTVVRLIEQRGGRIDRMDSPHDAVRILFPRDMDAFAPRRRDRLYDRLHLVHGLIGLNQPLPHFAADDNPLDPTEIARHADPSLAAEPHDLADAFHPVRALIGSGGLVASARYRAIRDAPRPGATLAAVYTDQPFAFFTLRDLRSEQDPGIPRWVWLPESGEPEVDLARVAARLQHHLPPHAEVPWSEAAPHLQTYVERLRRAEATFLPPRRRRALALARTVLDTWHHADLDPELREAVDAWRSALSPNLHTPHAHPRDLADAWLALIRRPLGTVLATRRRPRGWRPWTLDQLAEHLTTPFPAEALHRELARVRLRDAVDRRIEVCLIGIARPHTTPPAPIPEPTVLDAHTTTILARLRAAPLLDPDALKRAVDAHLATVREAHTADPFVDEVTAARVATDLHAALDRWSALSEDARLHLQAAARYFTEIDDGEDDLGSIIGFDDDLEVVRDALSRLG